MILSRDAAGRPISFIQQATPIVTHDLVLAQGRVDAAGQEWWLFAFDRRTGALAWQSAIDAPVLGSWASPAFDRRRRRVIVPSGAVLRCLDADTGSVVWQTPLLRPIVNASPLVTDDRGHADRCLVTDYDGMGASGRLYCVNVAPYHAAHNPYLPGQIVWSASLGGTSGNSPAYSRRLGLVFVATAGEYGLGPGRIAAFPIDHPDPLWVVENTIEEGFFGGVAVADTPGGAYVYAASYAFYGSTDSANLLKIDALTGQVLWSSACNRTASTPIPLPDGRVLLSTGLQGYGSVPAVQVFSPQGQLLWDSSLATWIDLNQNGRRDPGEFLAIGGWLLQPAAATATLGTRPRVLFVGELPLEPSAAGSRLYAIDPGALPGGVPGSGPWLLGVSSLAGGTPSLGDRNLYAVGPAGLFAFGPPPFRYDVDGDGEITIDDLYAWHAGTGRRDVNLDGVVDARDAIALDERLRRDELDDMRLNRPGQSP
jgi:outer membrane protein assembly factor BamB